MGFHSHFDLVRSCLSLSKNSVEDHCLEGRGEEGEEEGGRMEEGRGGREGGRGGREGGRKEEEEEGGGRVKFKWCGTHNMLPLEPTYGYTVRVRG